MKRLRILPGAAGIPLTATLGFVDGLREIAPKYYRRGKVTVLSSKTNITVCGALPGNQPDIKPDILAYLVEIRRERLMTNFHGRGERIRTSDSCVPNAVLYQAELHPEFLQSVSYSDFTVLDLCLDSNG
jgi:hypothetical protein